MLKESCNFVHGGPIPWAIISSSLVVMSHVKTEIQLYLLVTWILCCDHCRYWPLLINHIHFKFSRHGLWGSWNLMFFICHVTTCDQVNNNMWLLSFWLLIISYHPFLFSSHRSRDTMWYLLIKSYLPVTFSSCRPCGSGNITYFICHMTTWQRDQMVTWLCWRRSSL